MADQRETKPGVDALPTDALKEAGQQLLSLLAQRATEAAAQRVSGLADRLTDVTASGGDVRAALNSRRAETTTGPTMTGPTTTGPTTIGPTTSRTSRVG